MAASGESVTRRTAVVPLEMLQSLDYELAAEKFIALSYQEGARVNTLTMEEWASTFPDIHREEMGFQSGIINEVQFRKKVLSLLAFKAETVDDPAFDEAWNAILGSPNDFFRKVLALKTISDEVNVVLIAKTNSIHMQHLLKFAQIMMDKPDSELSALRLCDFLLYVSYECPGYSERQAYSKLYGHAIIHSELNPPGMIIVLPHSGSVAWSAAAKEWAAQCGIGVIEVMPHEDMVVAINKYLKKIPAVLVDAPLMKTPQKKQGASLLAPPSPLPYMAFTPPFRSPFRPAVLEESLPQAGSSSPSPNVDDSRYSDAASSDTGGDSFLLAHSASYGRLFGSPPAIGSKLVTSSDSRSRSPSPSRTG